MATLVAEILAAAARQCSVSQPQVWATATTASHIELRDDFMRETVDDVLQRVDLPAPIGATTTITGTGAGNYALPSDCLRLQRDKYAVYERNRTRRECIPVSTDGEWLYMQELGTAGAYRFYRAQGVDRTESLDFYRELEPGITVVVNYISDAWIVADGAGKSSFTNDATDHSRLPRRLLETGIVWRFRERRGLPFGDKNAEYEALLARLINDTRTRRSINFGGVQGRDPWDVPVPDVIPSS